MTLDPYERRALYEIALVTAVLAGALAAVLVVATSLSAVTIVVITVTVWAAGFAAIVLFVAS